MRKVAALLALLIAFGVSFGIGSAMANPVHADLVLSEPADQEKDEERDETDRMHRELDERFGDVSRVIIPPRGLIPANAQDPTVFVFLPEEPVIKFSELPEILPEIQGTGQISSNEPAFLEIGSGQYAPTATDQKANKYAPIQLKDLVFTGDGPAQDFMRSAVILLVGLAVVAAILLGIASKSAMGLKKKARAL